MAAIVFQSADEQVEAELRKAGSTRRTGSAFSTGSTCSPDEGGWPRQRAGLPAAAAAPGRPGTSTARRAGWPATITPRWAQIDLARLPNPVVRKVIGECLKQVRVLFREFGTPDRVHVEMARDLGKSCDDRQEIYRAGQERGAERDRHRDRYEELVGHRPNDEELLRYELWLEQDHRCLYTGDYISPAQLRATDNSIQIDHILPYSRSGDDSFRNKALVTAKANQDKRDRSLWEWFGESDAKRWQELETRVDLLRKASRLHKEKTRKLLLKSFAEREDAYKARHLQDTRYIIRVFRLLLEQHWPGTSRAPCRRGAAHFHAARCADGIGAPRARPGRCQARRQARAIATTRSTPWSSPDQHGRGQAADRRGQVIGAEGAGEAGARVGGRPAGEGAAAAGDPRRG